MGRIQSVVTSTGAAAALPGKAAQTPRISDLVRRAERIVPFGMLPLTIYFSLFLLAPLFLLILYSFWEASFFAVTRELTLHNYIHFATSPLYVAIMLKTFGCALLVALICTLVGYAISYAIVFRLKIWGPRLLVLVMATLLSSYIVRLYAVTTILGTNGLINQSLLALGVIKEPLSFLLYGYFAIIITLVYVYLPFAVLPIYAGLQDIDKRLLEASRDLGCGGLATFLKVTLPLSMRGVRTAFAFCFILSSADYVAPRLVGGMNGQMIGAIIADQFGGASNYPFGASLAVTMILGFALVLAGLFGIEKLARRIAREGRRRSGGAAASVGLPNIPVAETVTFLALIFLLAPLLTVFVFSFNDTQNPGIPFTGFTLHWYIDIVQRADFHRVLRTSLAIGLATVTGGLLIGVPAALSLSRREFFLKRPLGLLVFGPMAMPGIVLGVALLTTFVFMQIRLGVGPTMGAHILLVVPFIILVVTARLEKMDPRVDEAARDLGSSPARVFRTVTLPLLAPSLLGAAILAAAISLDELLVTNFTIGAQATVPVWISSQMRTGLTPALNAVAILMLSGSIGLIALAQAAVRLRRSLRAAGGLRLVG